MSTAVVGGLLAASPLQKIGAESKAAAGASIGNGGVERSASTRYEYPVGVYPHLYCRCEGVVGSWFGFIPWSITLPTEIERVEQHFGLLLYFCVTTARDSHEVYHIFNISIRKSKEFLARGRLSRPICVKPNEPFPINHNFHFKKKISTLDRVLLSFVQSPPSVSLRDICPLPLPSSSGSMVECSVFWKVHATPHRFVAIDWHHCDFCSATYDGSIGLSNQTRPPSFSVVVIYRM